jgi:hypothetical protein
MGDPIAEEGSHNVAGPCSDRRQFQDEKRWRPWGGWLQHRRARMKRLAKERGPTT